MANYLLIFLGGGLGALSRYLVGLCFSEKNAYLSTMAVNIFGCFLIGILFGIMLVKI